MAECKDCLCFKRCVALGVELDTHHSKEADKNCRHFKNAANYVKVKHGHWIKNGHKRKCSICKFVYYSNNDDWNGCPNCLAKMDVRSDT